MIYSLENEKLWVQVNDYGAELWSVYDKTCGIEHLWQGEASIWPRRAPICFPICGEFVGGSCTVAGQQYAMPLHGFGRDFVHALIEKTDTSLRLRLVANEQTRQMYPYDFVLDSVFTLRGNTLIQTLEVASVPGQELPVSVGYHTGYRCFHAPAESLADCELRFDVAEPTILALDAARVAQGQPSLLSDGGKTLQFAPALFVDTILLMDKKSTQVTLYNRSTDCGVTVSAPDAPNMLLWSCKEKVPYLCIEPWAGEKEIAQNYGDLCNKPGCTLVQAGAPFALIQEISIV